MRTRRGAGPSSVGAPILVGVLIVGTLAVLLVSAARPSHPFPQPSTTTHTRAPVSVSPAGPTSNSQERRRRHDDSGAGYLALITTAVLVLLAAGLLARQVRARRIRRPSIGWRTRRAVAPPAAPPSPSLEQVVVALDDALDRDPDARSIIECWTAVERALADQGFPRHRAETSTDFVERVLGSFGVAPEPLRRLGALYREARFSSHVLPPAARESAHDALVTLRAELRGVTRAS